jgi:hypothetical protein
MDTRVTSRVDSLNHQQCMHRAHCGAVAEFVCFTCKVTRSQSADVPAKVFCALHNMVVHGEDASEDMQEHMVVSWAEGARVLQSAVPPSPTAADIDAAAQDVVCAFNESARKIERGPKATGDVASEVAPVSIVPTITTSYRTGAHTDCTSTHAGCRYYWREWCGQVSLIVAVYNGAARANS